MSGLPLSKCTASALPEAGCCLQERRSFSCKRRHVSGTGSVCSSNRVGAVVVLFLKIAVSRAVEAAVAGVHE
jgi:hypothetical protein